MELADYAMIANSVPQNVKLKTTNEKISEQQTLAGAALGNKAKEMQNEETKSGIDEKAAVRAAISKNTKYTEDGKSTTDHRAVANELGQNGYADLADSYLMKTQKRLYDSHKEQVSAMASIAQGILSQPPEARAQAWAQGIQQAQQLGIDTTGHENYDGANSDNYLNQIISQAQTAKDYFEGANGRGADYIVGTNRDGSAYKFNKKGQGEAEPLTMGGKQIYNPVYTPDSIYSKSAAGQQGKADVDAATKPGIARDTARATAEGKGEGERAITSGKQLSDGKSLRSQLAMAQKLLPKATGSGIGAIVDVGLGSVGIATDSSIAATQLDTIGGWLTSSVPRMEGPQSNYDVASYGRMAAAVADRTKPTAERSAALKSLLEIQDDFDRKNEEYLRSKKPEGAPASKVKAPQDVFSEADSILSGGQ